MGIHILVKLYSYINLTNIWNMWNTHSRHWLIRVDIGGHPSFPTSPKQFSDNFDNLLFLAVFNFRGHFEGLNEGLFWDHASQ
jgi:hypothetical protein